MSKFFNFKTLVSFTALVIAGSAALFSVTGIGTLFAGAAVSAMVMAGALELGKLVGISFLYRYWNEIPKALKSYMLVASVVLIGITSAGIYGYLSSAYAKVAADPLKMNAEVQILNSLISKSTTGSNTSIRSAQNSLTELNRTANTLQKEINQASSQRDSLKAKSLTTDVAITTNSDIGTFVYISRAIGVPLDTVVKWFILVIVLVFDPLSICLILAYNFLMKREQPEEKSYEIYGESIPEERRLSDDLMDTLEGDDPFPQYMTKEETEDVLEKFWMKKTMAKHKDINIF